jgi:redox-sensitive bicupin YhaK (pirin superfamily)
MEIVTYVLEGALQHKDSMGTGSVVVPGEVQRMSAGKGVTHSEYNPSKVDPVHLLQIWILTEKKGIEPGYEQKAFGDEEKRGKLRLIASHDGRDGSVTIQQDTDLYATILKPGEKVEHALKPGRHAWVQVAQGEATVSGQALEAGDGAALSEEKSVRLVGKKDTEVLVFDLP